MPARAFLDTNILVYAIELAGPDTEKSVAARKLFDQVETCISTQVLGEFFSAVTSAKRASPLTADEAAAWVQLWKRFEVQAVTAAHVDLAIENVRTRRLNYDDALILASARLADCEAVYSEDFSAGHDYGGVTVLNPFASP